MIAALATILFLAAILCLAGIGAMIVEHSGGRIAAALRGELLRPGPAPAPLRFRPRARSQRPVRAEARWRVAA